MGSQKQIIVRNAEEADIPALMQVKGVGEEALHRDRLRDAREGCLRYLVLLDGQAVIGFVLLVFRRPQSWSDSGDTRRLPQIVDLRVLKARRGQGFGSAFLREIERIAAEAGFGQVYLAVEPLANPRAYALYLRLGYQPEQPEPYLSRWQFTDSGGRVHQGENWVMDLVKNILYLNACSGIMNSPDDIG